MLKRNATLFNLEGTQGSKQNPAKRVWLEEEKQRSERAFGCKDGSERYGVCFDEGS
jgi:hypothetical protein